MSEKEVTIRWPNGSEQIVFSVTQIEDVGPWLILVTSDKDQRWISAANCSMVRIVERQDDTEDGQNGTGIVRKGR